MLDINEKNFGKIINELAFKDNKIVLIVGDIGYGIFDDFRRNHPKKFYNFDICEQSIIGSAAGMALEGLKPWVYTITPFLIERPFEQIKLDINEQQANVNLVGFADYPTLGPTHAEVDAKKTMRLFKKYSIFSFLKNSYETKKFTYEISKRKGPCFMSLKTDKFLNKNW